MKAVEALYENALCSQNREGFQMCIRDRGVGAAADALLYGDANPSGRLPETFPYQLEDNPSHLNFPGDGKNVESISYTHLDVYKRQSLQFCMGLRSLFRTRRCAGRVGKGIFS